MLKTQSDNLTIQYVLIPLS